MTCSFVLERSLGSHKFKAGCQFQNSERKFFTFEKHSWCRYHLPLNENRSNEKTGWANDKEEVERFNKVIFGLIDDAKKSGGVADLAGVVFPAGISFKNYSGKANALPPVTFQRARFNGAAEFGGTTFNLVCFDEAYFGKVAGFVRAAFTEAATFKSAHFDEDAHFERAKFSGDIDFARSTFAHWVEFYDAIFEKDLGFRAANFRSVAHFERASFLSSCTFSSATFSHGANFIGAKFRQNAEFRSAKFESHSQFTGATFNAGAYFELANFDLITEFNKAKFYEKTSFSGASFGYFTVFNYVRFSKYVDFSGAVDSSGSSFRLGSDSFRRISFHDTKFGARARFANRKFLDATDFSAAIFKLTPEFHNSVLHQDTDFSAVTFEDHIGTAEVDAARAYRTLKLAMEQVRSRREQALFYRHEQKALRHRGDTPYSVKVISWLYEKTADYGERPMLPLAWLLNVFVVFTLIYLAIRTDGQTTISADDIRGTLTFSLKQIFVPFRVLISDPPVSISLAILCPLNSLLNIGFITLFVIALRRKFKLG